MSETTVLSNPLTRNKEGLFDNITYTRKENGKIDWRAMIPKEFLVVNKQWFESRSRAIPDTTDGLIDAQLLILLDGIKYVADLRGYYAVKYPNIESSPVHCTAVCEINWMSNYESDNEEKTFSGVGDANEYNTKGFGRNFLGPIAENRAFVRAVRNFLGIRILGQDEVSSEVAVTEPQESKIDPFFAELENLLNEKKMTFEAIKDRLIKEGKQIENILNLKDLPRDIAFYVMEKLKKVKTADKNTSKP